MGAALHVPRLPLRRRSTAGPASSTPPTSPRSCSRATCPAPAGSSRRTSCSTGCTRTSCGACAATSSTIPTDCPQRDERLGWTGDIQVFAPTATFLADCDAFLTSWLRDLAHEQRRAHGVVPLVVPAALPSFGIGGGDRRVGGCRDHRAVGALRALRRPRRAARRLPRACATGSTPCSRSDDLRPLDRAHAARRLARPRRAARQAQQAKVDGDLVASAYLARSLRIVADAAEVLGRERRPRAVRRARRAHPLRVRRRVRDAGRPHDERRADRLRARARLRPGDGCRAAHAARGRLAELVRERGYRIATGFVGTPLVADALADAGHLDAAERLLLQTECPSWLYPVTMGATTVWERWDSLLPDGSVNPGEMTSFNHYALGAVADWLPRGLAPDAGYRRAAPRGLAAAPRLPRPRTSTPRRPRCRCGAPTARWRSMSSPRTRRRGSSCRARRRAARGRRRYPPLPWSCTPRLEGRTSGWRCRSVCLTAASPRPRAGRRPWNPGRTGRPQLHLQPVGPPRLQRGGPRRAPASVRAARGWCC